ncbi:YbjQ family protein [Corynebacterium sp.]|uniref:YbjQ family protein n=1 Tax=Corynebacterium sp. TaxID=1720 RepID=UPI0025C4F4D0|nr:YbjQ family protein [Corynebacterium sp.]
MIVTTTNTVEGQTITGYLRVVSGETIVGINMFKDIGAGFRNIVGGRSRGYEGEVLQAREAALGEMVQRAGEMGADAIVGVSLDYENLGQGGMMMVSASGTAVTLSARS